MLKQIALIVGLTFAGSLAAFAAQAPQMSNGSGYMSSSSSKAVPNADNRKQPNPTVNGQTAKMTKSMGDQDDGDARKNNPSPSVVSTNASNSGKADNDDGLTRKSAVSKSNDTD